MIKLFKCSIALFGIFTLYCSGANAKEIELPSPDYMCSLHDNIQSMRSAELQKLVTDDQQDRENWNTLSDEEKSVIAGKDLIRRKRVGEIFGEGCFKTAADYAAASLIYQHGNIPDHYYLAFTWANRAAELGDTKQKGLIAVTVDRYLVSIDKKQLFGSQAYTDERSHGCYCLQPVEQSYPDPKRKEYSGASLNDRYDWLRSINIGKECSNAECSTKLQPTPPGDNTGILVTHIFNEHMPL